MLTTTNLIIFGLGFETTMPSTALSVMQAEKEGIDNFYLFCNHITIIPTRVPIIKLTCPGPKKPSIRIPGESNTALMVGIIVIWLQNK
jgi:hydrogenase expression/formation protein HypD